MRLAPIMLAAALAFPVTAAGQTIPNYDFQWASIGDVNNPAYDGPTSNGFPRPGTGSVGHEYRMSRLELTAGQWLEFVNTFGPLGDPFNLGRLSEGGGIERVLGGELRWRLDNVPEAANVPMSRLSWRGVAMYCNWLHNDKRAEVSALLTGAYDTSTWGTNPIGTFPRYTDAAARMPGAKFWIPSVSEWMKAVHYDPDKNGPGEGGWWLGPYGSDTLPTSGPTPLIGGNGQTNAGHSVFADWQSFRVGAYPDMQTPWGLLDASGGVGEWCEDWLETDPLFVASRIWDGSPGGQPSLINNDWAFAPSSNSPNGNDPLVGFRIASAIPTRGGVGFAACALFVVAIRRRSPSVDG